METPIITIGPNDNDVRVTRWYKPDGALVQIGDQICELESERTLVDILASEVGILRHLKREGARVHSGELVARIDPVTHRD